MHELLPSESQFISQLTEVILKNCPNEQFGVSELAGHIGMSRSNLLRKVKKLTGLSVSQLIRQVRLQKAMELLQQRQLNISEVSCEVGFGSTSYFAKCFREYYGFAPGELHKQVPPNEKQKKKQARQNGRVQLILSVVLILIVLLITYFTLHQRLGQQQIAGKSIAVLPFKNESADSTNIYLINGLMESTLTNLQKIKQLRVISRTSTEKFRTVSVTAQEIAKELHVSYIVEGSGQKTGDEILLNIQLIDAKNDKHLWAQHYQYKTGNIFDLQLEIARNITENIQVILTPDEQNRIEKAPTTNVLAYDYFLKGLDYFYQGNESGLKEAIPLFEQATAEDPAFARAYADMAIACYLLDLNHTEKQYTEKINQLADKALLHDDKLAQSLLAKAFFYIHSRQYELAEPYLLKAYTYSPNSAFVLNTLSEFYTTYKPNTASYLSYALKGIQIDMAANDSLTNSYIYLHLSNAFVQTGFIGEAIRYIDKSLAFNPENLYSQYVKAYIHYAEDRNSDHLKNALIQTYQKDSNRYDILQEIGKVCYYQRDYRQAYRYYSQFLKIKQERHLDVYRFENAKIARVLAENGEIRMAKKLWTDYLHDAEADQSIYKHLSLAVYYANNGNTEKALDHFELFAQEDDYHFWIVIFLPIDPLIDPIKNNPRFKRTYHEIENKFRERHTLIENNLQSEGLI